MLTVTPKRLNASSIGSPLDFPAESAVSWLAEKPVVALGPNSGRTAVDHRRSCRLLAGIGILDGAAWRPAACAGPPLPPTAGNENVSNGRVRGHVYRGTGILNNGPGAFGNTLSPNGQEKLMASRTGASWEKARGSESCRNSPPNRFGRCPLWVISGHTDKSAPCPLYAQ